MTQRPPTITEDELHAYADDQLDEPRRSEVQAYLRQHPEIAARVQTYRDMNTQLRRHYEPVLEEPPPKRFARPHLSNVPPRRLPAQLSWYSRLRKVCHQGIAATLTWMLVGGVTGATVMHYAGAREPAFVQTNLIQPAAFAHVIYSTEEKYPVEIKGSQQDDLLHWLSTRMHTKLQAPDLQPMGYEMIGGRLLPSTDRMAAQFMYQDNQGQRVTLYIRRLPPGKGKQVFHYSRARSVNLYYWTDGELGYALSGKVSKDHLLQLATTTYRSLNS